MVPLILIDKQTRTIISVLSVFISVSFTTFRAPFLLNIYIVWHLPTLGMRSMVALVLFVAYFVSTGTQVKWARRPSEFREKMNWCKNHYIFMHGLSFVIRDCYCLLSQLISGTTNSIRALVAAFNSTETPVPSAQTSVSVIVLFSIRMCVRRLCWCVCIAYVRSSQLRTNNQHPIDGHFKFPSKTVCVGIVPSLLCYF